MQFTIATIAAFAASYAAASPCSVPVDTTLKSGDVFHVMSIRSGSDIQYASMQASEAGFYLNKADQGAKCSGYGNDHVQHAYFHLATNGSLYLNTASNAHQQVYVDRSTTGQGSMGYTTGDKEIGEHQEHGPFAVVDGNLVFVCSGTGSYSGFLACPNAAGSDYTIHLDTGLTSPGGHTGCVGFTAKVSKDTTPMECAYSEAPVIAYPSTEAPVVAYPSTEYSTTPSKSDGYKSTESKSSEYQSIESKSSEYSTTSSDGSSGYST